MLKRIFVTIVATIVTFSLVGTAAHSLDFGDEFRDCVDCPTMVVLPAGTFTMGSSTRGDEVQVDKGTHRDVTIAKPFAVGKFEVTFGEWKACVADGGCNGRIHNDLGKGQADRPVVNVSWNDAKAYVSWLSRATGEEYRLLSEAEWVYAARMGTETHVRTDRTNINEQADRDQKPRETVPVGTSSANPFGLHHMRGNVWEWIEDCWNDSYTGAPLDGSARLSGNCSQRVLRGGSWDYFPWFLRSADRIWGSAVVRYNDLGFRVARSLSS